MSALGDAVADLVARLAAAGVPATANPDLVGQLVTAHGAVAYILPPQVESRVLSRGMRLSIEVNLLGLPPGGYTQLQPVWDLLGPAMDTLTCRTAESTTQTVGGVTFPGYLLTATHHTPC